MRALLLTCLVLTIALGATFGTATAQPAPPVGSCNFATKPCWDGALVCTWVSLQVPFCVENPLRA
ncbi:MAG: hypothetical protein QOI63_1666 [Thermoplasmata archaeon]|jgi:hypothetical protein|nr:hypothetical protein [Thermoplasmata archaeon]